MSPAEKENFIKDLHNVFNQIEEMVNDGESAVLVLMAKKADHNLLERFKPPDFKSGVKCSVVIRINGGSLDAEKQLYDDEQLSYYYRNA